MRSPRSVVRAVSPGSIRCVCRRHRDGQSGQVLACESSFLATVVGDGAEWVQEQRNTPGPRARHGKRGGQPLTARGGTAASCLQWGGCVRALASCEYLEVNHPEVTREKGGKSVTESPTAVRIHIWILRDRETASGGNRIATHAMPPIWHIGFRHRIVAGFLVRECRPKTMSSQRGRKARAGLRTDLGRYSDSDNGESDNEYSNGDSYDPRSTQVDTQRWLEVRNY